MPRKCVPTDKKLYEKTKSKVYRKIKKHSAYRSGKVVSSYKKAFSKKHGSRKQPYKGCKRKSSRLKRWFDEDWKSDTGKYKYTSKSSVYRPSKRITKDTPLTHSEVTKKELSRAKREKSSKGRVSRFRKKRSSRRRE
uniref:DUF5872 domain-containing protein n=1 Tax=viral metagenome TaxID=1070528 RepID=A0A6C0LIB6_9ZZZZ